MPKKYLIANWKMELSESSTSRLANILDLKVTQSNAQMIVCPSFLFLTDTITLLKNSPIHVGAQDVHTAESGKYTGEISAKMLEDTTCTHCIVGHSERRQYFGESDALIARKVTKLLEHNIVPIICVGESLEERISGTYLNSIRTQVISALTHVQKTKSNIILAYEPIWAIGTGKTANTKQIQEVHAHMRKILQEEMGEYGNDVSLLYGGSLDEKNSYDIFRSDHVDGGLVGGSALKADVFVHMFEDLSKTI